ncbi:hypothetical protein GGI05_001719, partial [Coemansia sp. RSA 2603]
MPNTPPEKSSYLDTPLGSRQGGSEAASGYFAPPGSQQSEHPPGYEDPALAQRDLAYDRQPYPPQNQGQWSPYPPQSQSPYPPPSQAPYPPQAQAPYPPQAQAPYPPPSQSPYPPQTQSPYPPQQFQQQPPQQQSVRLTLLNPRQLSSGFSSQPPQALQYLAPRATAAAWTQFIGELNDQLRHAPGALATGVTNFWLVNLATLGMSSHAREMYRGRVEAKAADIVERYNRTVFAEWGIRAAFDVV